MAEDRMYDLVIIGGGPAGLTAGMYAMRAALRTVLVENKVSRSGSSLCCRKVTT